MCRDCFFCFLKNGASFVILNIVKYLNTFLIAACSNVEPQQCTAISHENHCHTHSKVDNSKPFSHVLGSSRYN